MENKKRIFRQDVVLGLMNVVIILMVLGLLVSICLAGESLHYAYEIPYDDDSFYYMLNDGRYYDMVDAYHQNVSEGFGEKRAMQEYYGVAKYYEAASFYKAFLTIGDGSRADRERQKMELAYEEMGGWSMVAEDIHAQLGLD